MTGIAESQKLQSTHGMKKTFGVIAIINGRYSLAYVKNNKVISYMPLDELNRKFYTEKLAEYTVDF